MKKLIITNPQIFSIEFIKILQRELEDGRYILTIPIEADRAGGELATITIARFTIEKVEAPPESQDTPAE